MKPPPHMRRDGSELGRARDDEGVVRVETPFGLPAYLICRHEDVRLAGEIITAQVSSPQARPFP
ncbi:hypothetical protein SAMN05444920_118249 [Nonomuraea solani]|uniref:Uncharacterized protein n=1 Tax=Nonomuraea solani TaxID=1144553 RepID=A0A1H6ET74_9ACTN|nr:hypothetical protein [Nonomuraea solani]SEH01060.1 hypothetical protein SAMN05444920_118249 [Nonomuraea solani]